MNRMLDGVTHSGEGLFLLLGRLAIAALYLPSGYGKLTGPAGFAGYLASKGVPGPAIAWAVLAGAIEFFAAAAIVAGFQTRLAAALLCLFTIVAAFIGHSYWGITDAAARMPQYIHFWKDIAIAGGLLFVFVRGAGAISIDRR